MIISYILKTYDLTDVDRINKGTKLFNQCIFVCVYLLVCYVIIEYIPKHTYWLIPVTIFAALVVNIKLFTSPNDPISTSYIIFGVINMSLYMLLVPSQWWIYHWDFLFMHEISIYLSIFYFTISAKMLHTKVRNLYKLLIENKRLIKSMKKILETFPHGVLIQVRESDYDEEIYFTNHEFQNHIYSIKENTKELGKRKQTLLFTL